MEFATAVTDFWLRGVPTDAPTGRVHVVVDAVLSGARAVSLMTVTGGPQVLAVTPERADALGVEHDDEVAPKLVVAALERAGITLNDADAIFHFTVDAGDALGQAPTLSGVRALTLNDSAAFDRFIATAPDDDVDEAFVEVDHWLVFGCLVDDVLVSAASMYPWDGSTLANTGVLTLPDYRGRGLGVATVRAMSARARELGHEPQYRCQVDNEASMALAQSAGLTLLGQWEVALPSA